MLSRLVRSILRLVRWRIEGDIPAVPRLVAIGAPHTSNWDFLVFLGVKWYFDIPVSFMGKASLFRPPFGALMRRLGGIPIERDRREDVVTQMARRFTAADRLWLVVAPEGTRSRAGSWRSGFYRIAEAAGVPILLCGIDFGRRRAVIGPLLQPTGDVAADMARIRSFFSEMTGKHPDKESVIRLDTEG